MNKQDENALTEAWHSDTDWLNGKIDEFFKAAQDHAYALGLARGLAESKSAPPVEWFVQWIRNNYQNHPNIARLCDAMREAAPEAPQPKPSGPETMTVQEVWEAAGGNPGIRATKQGVLDALKMLDAVCDEAQPAEQEPVAAQHRFRHPEKGTPDWSVWQPCKINNKRPAHEIDSQGYQVQYRALYTAPQPAISHRWTPTAENINALPEPIRRYIADLSTNADPAGTVRDLTIACDTIRALEASNRMLRGCVTISMTNGDSAMGRMSQAALKTAPPPSDN